MADLLLRARYLDPGCVAYFLAMTAFIVLSFWALRLNRPRWENAAYAFLIILGMRLLLFENPIPWHFYKKYLAKKEHMEPRALQYIEFKYNSFFLPAQEADYLAVGSSQTRSIYNPYIQKNKDIALFSMAAFAPLDYVLYRNYIRRAKPKTVLLFLSEFDLSRIPSFNSTRYLVPQYFSMLDFFPDYIRAASLFPHLRGDIFRFLAAEIVPEYRYAFIFEGFWDILAGKNDAVGIQTIFTFPGQGREQVLNHLKKISTTFNEKASAFHFSMLEKFIIFCEKNGIRIVISEGQYNPLGYTEKSNRLNQMVRKKLTALTKKYEHVIFIPRSKSYPLSEDDFKDAVHTTPDAGYKFTTHLMDYLK